MWREMLFGLQQNFRQSALGIRWMHQLWLTAQTLSELSPKQAAFFGQVVSENLQALFAEIHSLSKRSDESSPYESESPYIFLICHIDTSNRFQLCAFCVFSKSLQKKYLFISSHPSTLNTFKHQRIVRKSSSSMQHLYFLEFFFFHSYTNTHTQTHVLFVQYKICIK